MRVIYVDIDSLRPDHLGCYGYQRPTSPNIDRVAADGTTFTQAYCSSSPCVPSRASLISGRFGVRHGALSHWGPGSAFRFPGEGHHYRRDMPLLTRHLREHGYRTVSFSSFPDRHQAFWFCGGWSEMHSPTLRQGEENADEVNAAVIPWLRRHGAEDDYFLHVHYWDPHRDYTFDDQGGGQDWIDLIATEPPPAWPDDEAIAAHQANYGPFTASELFPFRADGESPVDTMPKQIASRADYTQMVNGYDGEIRFADDRLGQLLDVLDGLGVLDETAVIISSDHGEAMGEHGVYGDHVCADEAVHHIPMIIKWPDATPDTPHRDGLLYNVDLPPTLCDLLGVPVPPGWDGTSFADAVRGGEWAGRPHLVWEHGLYSCQRAVRTDAWLYVRTYHPGLFPFEETELVDIRADPHQTTNLAAEYPDVVAELDGVLTEWLHRCVTDEGDPMEEIVRSGPWRYVRPEPWIARLRDRGRDAAAKTIEARVGQPARTP